MYYTGQLRHNEARIGSMQTKLKKAQDSLKTSGEKLEDERYFGLEDNDNAIDYFVDKGFTDTPALAAKIKDGINTLNENPDGNPLTQNEPINGQKFLINKIKILNHRWIIADFSNGTAWGEALIRYFVDDKGVVTYETIQTLLYANTIK